VLIGLGQKGMWSGPGAPNSPGADGVPPAKRRGLNHPGVPPAERGKPVALLCRTPQQGKSQGDLKGQRVKEEGASESWPVIGRIGVATSPHGKPGPLPSGVGGREPSANRRRQQCRYVGGIARILAGAAAATVGNSVTGSAVVTSRETPRPMGRPRIFTDALSHA
jgi:hypothetical protein